MNDIGVILATFLLLVVLFFVLRLLLGPLRIITRLLINSGIALVCLLLINLVGRRWGIHLPVNPVSVIGVGILGLPGLILLIFLTYLFN
ncbi:MAG: pro-sigmaK processing inhibitor BofA family protein [Peptococcia bacterium]